MNVMMRWVVVTVIVLTALPARGQYFMAEEYPVPAAMVLQDQYITVPDFFFPGAPAVWDAQAFTRIYVVRDGKGSAHHILVQSDITGKANYIAFSKSAAMVFERKDKPYFLLQHCLKGISSAALPVQHLQHQLKCILQRLNECAY